MARLILASQSPRRRELLGKAGYVFAAVRPEVSEVFNPELSLGELTMVNGTRKALFAARRWRDAVILAADTLVAVDGELLGKPRNLGEARTMLRRLSGRVHDVCTSVVVIDRNNFIAFADISHVHFRPLTEKMISKYVRKVDPLDKAGAYAAQAEGGDIIAGVRGSFTNVVGLPMERTCAVLAQLGIHPRVEAVSAGNGGAATVFSALSRRKTR